MTHFIPRAFRYFFFCLLIIIAIAINTARVFLLYANDYKDDLQKQVRDLTELPIHIGHVRAQMRGFDPELILEDVQLLAENGNVPPAIKVEQIRLRVKLIPLIFSQQLLPSSWLTIVGANLSIIRNEEGVFSIDGLPAADSEQPEWLLKGGRYEVLRSSITFIDKQKNRPPIEFINIDVLLKNKGDGRPHELHFLTMLPEKYGKSLRASISFQGDVFQAKNIDSNVYIEGRDINLAELMTVKIPLELGIVSGQSSFKNWSQFENSTLTRMRGNVHAKNVKLERYDKKKKLHVDELKTAFNVQNKENGYELAVTDLILETDGKKWPSASFSIAADSSFNQLSASIQQIDLQEMTRLVTFFTPLDMSKHSLVKKLDLKGMLKDLVLFVDNENSYYAVNGVFNNIFTRAFDGIPEIKNLTGHIKANHEKGLIVVNTNKGNLFFPKLFRKSLAIEQLTGALEWVQTPESLQISSNSLVFNTNDIETETQFLVNIPKNEAPVFMDLQASFANMQDISHVSNYYPVSIMDEDVVDWLDHAFVSGQITQGNVLVYGELNKFPFVGDQGVFEVLYDMNDVELQYNADWPNLNNVDAQVLFLKNSVTIDMTHAQVNHLTIKNAILEIPSFATSDHLLVKGKVEGQLLDGLHFLQKTPLYKTIDSVLGAITPTGLARVDLDLNIPLADTAEVTANVVAHLSQAALKVNAVDLYVNGITGALQFTETGLFCEDVNAKTLGFPIEVSAQSDEFTTSIDIKGKTDIQHLEQQFDFFDSWILKDQRLNGEMTYQLKLDLPANEETAVMLKINSDLVGFSVDFPEILKKPAEEKSSLVVSMVLNERELLPVFLNYKEDLKIAMNINKQTNEMHSAHIVYGEGQSTAFVDKGIKIQIVRDKFELNEWIWLFDQEQTEQNESDITLNEMSLITKQLLWKNKAYGSFELAMLRLNNQWQGNVTSAMAKGAFILPIEQRDDDVIKFNMAHVNFTQLMQIDFQDEKIGTEDLPLVDVVSEQFWWKDNNLGRLHIETERLANGIRFKRIDVISEQHKIELNADWIKNDKNSNTEMHGNIDTSNFGAFLAQFDFDNDFKETEGSIELFAKWSGSPYQFSIAAIDAEMDLALNEGRLASVEPGFGRILGLIAIDQWLKRLTLDFGDLYKQGMSFNSITGHFDIEHGKAVTKNLLIDAVPAQIFITGETDLTQKTLNHSMGVIPKSSGALPIAGTIVSGIAGVITQVFTNEYKEGYFFGSQYKVDGHWDNINVTPVHEQDGLLMKTWTGLTDFSWMKSIAE